MEMEERVVVAVDSQNLSVEEIVPAVAEEDKSCANHLPSTGRHKDNNKKLLVVLTRFHAGYFRISLSLSSQALLWKILSNQSAGNEYIHPHPLRSFLAHALPSTALVLLWSLSLISLISLSLLYSLRCLHSFPSVRSEFSHPIGVNYLFAPFISSLLLLQSSPFPFLRPHSPTYTLLFLLSSIPILTLDLKIYGQWFTKGGSANKKKTSSYLSLVANPTTLISVIGNLVGARAAAQMGWSETATCMFALGMSHYLVLFVTLYQRISGNDSLPAMLRPVFFLFFAVPSMASVAWYSIVATFDTACKMLFFLSLFLFASLMTRPALFKRSMRRFNVAWWAYSFPLTILAQAATRYAQEVQGGVPNFMMLVLSLLSVVVTLTLIAFTAIKTHDILPRNDPFVSTLELPTTATSTSL